MTAKNARFAFLLLLLLASTALTGCLNAVKMASKMGAGNYAAAIVSPKTAPELPLICFSIEWHNLPSPMVWCITLTNHASDKPILVDTVAHVFGPLKTLKTPGGQLILLHLPAGKYSVRGVDFGETSDSNPGVPNVPQYTFEVKEAQITYAGRLDVDFAKVQKKFPLNLLDPANHYAGSWEWRDTTDEDEQWAKSLFPKLQGLPSEKCFFNKGSSW